MFRWQNIMRFVNKKTLLGEHVKQSRRKATCVVDGVTKDEYDLDVHEHINRLLERMKRF